MAYSRMSSGASRLPFELLSEIFHIVFSSYGYSQPTEFIPAIRFSQVCRQWQRCAHTDPRLWTRLSLRGCGVELNDYLVGKGSKLNCTQDMLLRDCAALTILFRRSKRLSLSLLVEHGYPYGPTLDNTDYGVTFRQLFIPALVNYIRRCDTLELGVRFNCFPWEGTAMVIATSIREAHNLHTLKLSRDWAKNLKLNPSIYAKLRCLHTTETDHALQLFGGLPAHSLRRLDIRDDYIDWVDLAKAMSCFPALSHAVLSKVSPTYSTDMDRITNEIPITRMEHLCHLFVTFSHGFHVENAPVRVLAFIDTPNLRSFHLSLSLNRFNSGSSEAIELSAFLARSPSLTRLSFEYGASFSAEEFARILSSVPRLESIAIADCMEESGCEGTEPLLEVLSEVVSCNIGNSESTDLDQHVYPRYCPSLQDISIKSSSLISTTTVLRLLSARSSGKSGKSSSLVGLTTTTGCGRCVSDCLNQAPLRRLRIEAPIPSSSDYPEWEQFRQEGVQVEIL